MSCGRAMWRKATKQPQSSSTRKILKILPIIFIMSIGSRIKTAATGLRRSIRIQKLSLNQNIISEDSKRIQLALVK